MENFYKNICYIDKITALDLISHMTNPISSFKFLHENTFRYHFHFWFIKFEYWLGHLEINKH